MNPPTIDPGVVTLIQSRFLDNINIAFSTTANYAFNLLYLFAALELVVLALIWMFQRDIRWDKLFLKMIKIGLIFFTIQNYGWLLNTILNSFAQLAGLVINSTGIAEYIFNPAKIWQYGYDVGVHLLQLASTSNLFGLSMIQTSLGIGILLTFGLLGIQMITQMVSFYLISFGALILLPFGAFTPSSRIFDKAVQAIFQAGLRLMVLIIVIGIAVTTWNGFQLIDLATTTNFNINQPLGLFFTALLFLCLAFYLPKVIGQIVGDLGDHLLDTTVPIVTTSRETATTIVEAPATSMSGMQAATIIPTTIGSPTFESTSSIAAASTIPTPTMAVSSVGSIDTKASKEKLSQASVVPKSISESTVKKIKEAVVQAMKEKPAKN